jgi:P4 family phage/plasmid primase-like protien
MAQHIDNLANESQLRLLIALLAMANPSVHAVRGADGKPNTVRSAIPQQALRDHLTGKVALEIYPVVGATAHFGVFDFDFKGPNKGTPEHRRALLAKLVHTLNVRGVLFSAFLSGGGFGFHVHLYFPKWSPARDIRQFMIEIAKESGFKKGNGGALNGEVEIFPAQDSVGEGGIGNCIGLPLTRESLPLDPVSLTPIAKEIWCAPDIDGLLNSAPPEAPPEKRRKRSGSPSATPEQIASLLPFLKGDDRDSWVRIGMAIHNTLGDAGEELWLDWSKDQDGYKDERDCRYTWASFGRGLHKYRLGYGSLLKLAKAGGWTKPKSNKAELDRKDPRACAKAFLDAKYPGTAADGLDLVWYQQDFYSCHKGPWIKVSASALRSQLGEFLEGCVDEAGDAFRPRGREQGEILDAVRDLTLIEPADGASPPFWRSGEGVEDPASLISMANGLLHPATGRLLPPDRDLFTLSHHEIQFDEDCAPPVHFLRFLGTVWPEDKGEIALLQEWIGLLLTADTSFQKLLLLIGPPRAGKSTIASVVMELVGPRNTTVTDLHGLTEAFGLEPLIDKTLISVPDARFSGGKDAPRAVSRLNAISGEDRVQANRKGRQPWVGVLRGRFMMVTNEAPKLIDNAGALAGRIVPLVFENSFVGREDWGLMAALREELPEIFHWALRGYQRLKAAQSAGQHPAFTQPPSSLEQAAALRDQMSPISGFVDEYLDVVNGAFCPNATLKALYEKWCGEQGQTYIPPLKELVRQLNAFSPLIKKGQTRTGGRGVNGIRPKSPPTHYDYSEGHDDNDLPF